MASEEKNINDSPAEPPLAQTSEKASDVRKEVDDTMIIDDTKEEAKQVNEQPIDTKEETKNSTEEPVSKVKAPSDPEFLVAAAANKADENAEWQYNSSDESSSDSSSESDDESNLPDLNDVLKQIKASIDKDERAPTGKRAPLSSDSEDEVDLKAEDSDDALPASQALGQHKPPRTQNEEVPSYRIPDIVVLPSMKVSLLGDVMHIVPDFGADSIQVVIQARDSGRITALDHGSVLCREDRVVIGEVYETLGNVENPYYVLGFNNMKEMEDAGIQNGSTVYFVEDTANRVFTDMLLKTRGTDASNVHDEEIDDAEIEFSDDEKEAAYKATQKSNKKKRNRKHDKGRGPKGQQDPDSYEQTPARGNAPPHRNPFQPSEGFQRGSGGRGRGRGYGRNSHDRHGQNRRENFPPYGDRDAGSSYRGPPGGSHSSTNYGAPAREFGSNQYDPSRSHITHGHDTSGSLSYGYSSQPSYSGEPNRQPSQEYYNQRSVFSHGTDVGGANQSNADSKPMNEQGSIHNHSNTHQYGYPPDTRMQNSAYADQGSRGVPPLAEPRGYGSSMTSWAPFDSVQRPADGGSALASPVGHQPSPIHSNFSNQWQPSHAPQYSSDNRTQWPPVWQQGTGAQAQAPQPPAPPIPPNPALLEAIRQQLPYLLQNQPGIPGSIQAPGGGAASDTNMQGHSGATQPNSSSAQPPFGAFGHGNQGSHTTGQ